ncbi:hypothetical protein ACWEGQ_36395 [Streptomyces seoulensis]
MLQATSSRSSPDFAGDDCRASAHPPIDHDKSPLLDADHDAVRIADALRSSPHITFVAPAAPGDETVWFRDADGTGFELSLAAVEPDPDGERVAYAWDAVAAAIANYQHFIRAALEQRHPSGRSTSTPSPRSPAPATSTPSR